jgi:hypothetical protein
MRALVLAGVLAASCLAAEPRLEEQRAALRAALPGDDEPRASRLEKLARALRHPLPAVRLEAARRLGMRYLLFGEELKPLALALDDRDPAVRAEAARALLWQLPFLAARKPPAARASGPAAPPPEPPAAALPGPGPFAAARALTQENWMQQAELGRALEARLRGAVSPLPAPGVWQLLQQTTLAPNVPMPMGSQALPP